MNIEEVHEYCKNKPGTIETFPFDDTSLVFKVCDKMFALLSLDEHKLALKCDPARAIELRETYSDITPGYHFNKKHWNTVDFRGSVPAKLLFELIDHSYQLVVSGLPKSKQEELKSI